MRLVRKMTLMTIETCPRLMESKRSKIWESSLSHAHSPSGPTSGSLFASETKVSKSMRL
jgi:hypothetical protein